MCCCEDLKSTLKHERKAWAEERQRYLFTIDGLYSRIERLEEEVKNEELEKVENSLDSVV